MGSVLGWLDSLWNFFSGGVAQLWHWIIDAFKSIWSFAYQVYDVLARGIADVASALDHFARSVESWIVHSIDALYNLALKWVNDLYHWSVSELNRVIGFINAVYHWALQQVDNLIRYIERVYADIVHWVISAIWNPLYNFVSSALHWIEREGAYVFDILTHPDKLVALIESYLWKAWLVWLRRLAIPIVTFIISQFRSVIPDLISVAEDILTKVL